VKNVDDGPDGLNDAAFERALGGGRKGRRVQRQPATAAITPSVRDAVWRSVCDATTAALAEQPQIAQAISALDRGLLAAKIGHAAIRLLETAPRRVWTGTLNAPCWVCGCGFAVHDHGAANACPLPLAVTASP
jgi:hypothetical protein